MTYRDRRLAKAERLRGWADGREAKAETSFATASRIADMIPFGQPILVGHHSEGRHRRDLARIDRGMSQGVENSRKAEQMRSRADNIEAATDGAIYSDDPDAIEALTAKLAGLEAKREQVKAHNREMRKPGACDHPPECDCRTRYPRQCSCSRHPLPGYVLSNLGGNITRARQRLVGLQRQEAARSAEVLDETTADGITVRTTASRVEVEFPDRPSVEVRDGLKAHGFRWDRVAGCWHGRDAEYAATVAGLPC